METNQNPIKTWLTANDRSAAWLGKQLGLGRSQSADIVAGRRTASQAQRMAMELLTNGQVPASAWQNNEHRLI